MGDLGTISSLLRSFQLSIAEVCRKIGINRQQFNKYLNGTASPSRRNLRIICEFFGVTEAEITMSASEFATIISPRTSEDDECSLNEARDVVCNLLKMSESLEKYEGYYFR